MGSPVSPIVANLYMEDSENKALRPAPGKPHVWLRYVHDTFVILHEYDLDGFTKHINGLDPDIKFTIEEETDSGLHRKKIHTDKYIN